MERMLRIVLSQAAKLFADGVLPLQSFFDLRWYIFSAAPSKFTHSLYDNFDRTTFSTHKATSYTENKGEIFHSAETRTHHLFFRN